MAVVVARAQQIGVGADRRHATRLEQRDTVGEHDGRGAVGDHEGRRLGHDLAQRVFDERLGVDVECRQRVVEHEHRRPCGDRTREREALALPSRERQSLFADDRVDPVGQVLDEAGLRDGERFAQHRLGIRRPGHEVFPTEQHVLADGLREQGRVFERHADVGAQLFQCQVAHVDAVDRDAARGDVVEPPGQGRQSRLPRAGQADERHRFARFERQVDAVDQVALGGRGILIPEVRAFERERAARRRDRLRVLGVGDGVLFVEHLEDAVGRGARVEQEREEEADRLHGPAQHGRHREEGDELGDLQLAGLLQYDPDAETQRERDVGQQHEPEPDPADCTGLADLGLAQRLGLTGELLQRVLAAAERLEDPDAVDALFDRGREVTGLVLALAGERAVRLLEAVARVPERCAHHEEGDPERPVPAEQQQHADEDREHVDDQQHHAEGHPPTQHADVLHHAAQQLTRLPAVVERDGQVLQALVEGGANLVLDLGRRSQHEPAPQPHHDRFEQAEDEDRDGAPDELGRVAR